jgi:hypothetical protein
MAYDYDEYLVPAVGYAMQMLGRGESPDALASRIASHDNFGFLTPEEIGFVIAEAQSNNNATDLGRIPNAPGTSANMFGASLREGQNIGARIKIIMKDDTGLERETTVLVNTSGDQTIQQLLDFASDLVSTPGSELYRATESRVGTVADVSLISLFQGGFNRGIQFTE